ncbi:MAG: DUF4238 domain-containing protein [Thermoleophilia bacterium]
MGKELLEIVEGKKPWPESNAKRQHYVPRFQLADFTLDGETLFQLKTATGAPRKTTPTLAASKKFFYVYPDAEMEGGKVNVLEGFFAMVENHAAPILRRLAIGDALSDEQRATLSFFFALQWGRTPGALKKAQEFGSEVMASLLASNISDKRKFAEARERLKAEGDDDGHSDEEAEELRQRSVEMLRSGDLKIVDPSGGNTMGMLVNNAGELAMMMFGTMKWTVFVADEHEFVASDRGCACFDPTPMHPWSGHAPLSSPNAATIFPISRTACVLMTPSDDVMIETVQAANEDVRKLNLRTYGWADKLIFGATQGAVVRVRKDAKRHPELLVRPRPTCSVVLIERDPDDDALAREHVARGWDPYMVQEEPDGTVRYLDYMVVGEDGNAVEVTLTADELVEQRERKAHGLAPDSPVELQGGISTAVIPPISIRPTRNPAFRQQRFR